MSRSQNGAGQALVLAVISALLGALIGWYVADDQAVRQFRATEHEKEVLDQQDGTPLVVSDVHTGDTQGGYELHGAELELNQVNTGTEDRGGVQVLRTSDETDDPHRTSREIIFTLTSQLYRPVKISSIRAEIEGAPAVPLGGTVLGLPAAGDSGVSQLGIDLDATDKGARILGPSGELTRRKYFDERQLALTKTGEPVTISTSVSTSECYCSFNLVISIDDGRELRILDGDKPWEISALSDDYARAYDRDVEEPYVPCAWTLDGCSPLPGGPPR